MHRDVRIHKVSYDLHTQSLLCIVSFGSSSDSSFIMIIISDNKGFRVLPPIINPALLFFETEGFVVLDGADQGTSWKLAGQPGGTPSLAIRSTQKPTSALELVSTLSKSSISGDIHLVGQVGFGTVEAYWNGETSAIPGIIESARSAAHNVGGALMIERCPPELKSDLDVFGDLGAPLEIMRRMKQQYDPKGTLSPGRFAGRI